MTAAPTTDTGEAFDLPADFDLTVRLALSETRCQVLELNVQHLTAFIEDLKSLVESLDAQNERLAEQLTATVAAMREVHGGAHVEH